MVVGDGIQTDTVHFLHGDVAFLGHLHDLTGRAAQFATGHQQLFDISAALEGLPDGVAAGEQVLVGYDVVLFTGSRIAVGNRGIVTVAVIAGFLMGPGGTAFLAPETALALRLAVVEAAVITELAVVAELSVIVKLAAFAKAAIALAAPTTSNGSPALVDEAIAKWIDHAVYWVKNLKK
jgi:hypothetical protein